MPSGLESLVDKAPRRMGAPAAGRECKWQVITINMKKRSILWLMKSTSEMLGRDGNISKDEHTKMQPHKKKAPWRKFLVYSNILSKKNKKRISP